MVVERHFPEESKELFVPWFESEGAKVTLSQTLDIYEDEVKMMGFDLIVQAITMGIRLLTNLRV